MDESDRNPPNFSRLERHLGRVLRHMAAPRMLPLQTAMKPPPTDIYETENSFIIFMEVPGVNPESINIVADQTTVSISGGRMPPPFPETTCIHQLEIEHGNFQRVIVLPTAIDVAATRSTCKNGFLKVVLPKHQSVSRIRVEVK